MKLKKILVFTIITVSTSLFCCETFSAENNANTHSQFKWKTIPFPFEKIINESLMFDSLNGWTLSYEVQELHQYKNGKWLLSPKPNNIDYKELFGFSKNNVWLSCFDNKKYRNFLRHFNGQKWENIYTPNADGIRGMDYLAPDNIWGACEWGEIIHFDGKEWKLVPSPVFGHLSTVTMISDTLGYLTGEYRGNGILLKWNGKELVLLHQVNDQIEKVMMVNPEIGWLFVDNNKSIGFILRNDQLLKVNYSKLIRDTINISARYDFNSLSYYANRTVLNRGKVSYSKKPNGDQEILIFPVSGNFEAFYQFTSDGSVHLVKCKPTVKQANLSSIFGDEGTSEYGAAFFDADKDGDEDIYIINTEIENRLKLYGGNQKIKSPSPIAFIDAAGVFNVSGVLNGV